MLTTRASLVPTTTSAPSPPCSSAAARGLDLDGADLGRTTPLALLGEDLAVAQELTAPDTPGLATGQSAGQAGLPHRAGLAEGLGNRDVVELLGEEQVEER